MSTGHGQERDNEWHDGHDGHDRHDGRSRCERIRLPHQVNAVRISRTFYGKPEVWPDIIIPALKVAIEYDDPGRDGTSHRGLKEASDREKDAALADVGWEVIRVRAGGLGALGPYSIVCPGVSVKVADRILELLAEIRGTAAVEALRVA